MRKNLLFLIVGLIVSLAATAQPICGFDHKMDELKKSDPDFARTYQQTEEFIRNFILAHPENARKPKVVVTIPVVVHVMHTGGAIGSIYNPTDAQIMGAIDYLNQVYAGTYAGMEAPVEGGGVVNMELQFVLAKRTPSCGYTNGIERIDASGLPNYVSKGVNSSNSDGCPDVVVKDLARWNPSDYYNIWVVNKIDGKDGTIGQFTAGFAYYAGASARVDGTVMLATQMKTGQKTLPHEIGHAFNLAHTFQGSSESTTCPVNTNCNSDGDGVCDTDPVAKNSNSSGVVDFTCRSGTNSCTGTAYTKNTESNFMSYTYCYTLFTNGQKARVQAAMSLPSRASLAVSPGLTPCGSPQINFGAPSYTVGESAQGSDGCRKFTDYTYSMTIGEVPTAAATVTLSFGGTAVKGIDYDLTTNGSFTTPSAQLTFPSGAANAQAFTLRVYDDASVEPSETIVLDFSVATAGNAVKGTVYPTQTITITDKDRSPVAASNDIYSLGTIASITSTQFNTDNQKVRLQILYKASELKATGMIAGTINAMQLYVYTKGSTGSFNSFTVRVGKSSVDYLVDGGVVLGSDFTTVYTTPSFTTITGWNLFTFTTPYIWDGESNVVVEMCYAATSGTGKDAIGLYSDGGSATQANFIYKIGIDCSTNFSTFNYYSGGTKPIAKFGLNVTGTDIETTTSGNHTEYLGVGSDDYFFSATDKIMARIKSLTLDPGCVQVSVQNAGSSWQPLQSGNRSSKVFSVSPTNNGATTGYNISLYFTADELDGRDPATLKIAKTSAADFNSLNTTNTVIATPTVAMLGTNSVFSADFTGFSRFFLVDNMFALPLNLISFTGKLNGNLETDLRWEVSGQRNFSGFDVERSSDGQRFDFIQKVSAVSAGQGTVRYSYIDNSVPFGVIYYRLKMIDNDGQFAYSEVIKVVNQGPDGFVSLAGNPVTNTISIIVKNADNRPMDASLFNALGAKIATWHLGQRSGNISIPIEKLSLASGIYLLQVSDGNKIATVKVQKK